MKTLKLLLSFLFISFITNSCTNEDLLTSPLVQNLEDKNITTRSNGYGLDKPYITRPDLDPNKLFTDTTNFWVLGIKTDKYINGVYNHGKKGLYTQVQYTTIKSAYDSDWKNAVIQIETPVYLRKKDYPFGNIYFRARTMEKEELAKISDSRQYQYASELSPWSAPMFAINNIYNKSGVSLTKNNIIVDIKFTFNATYTGDLWDKDLSNFKAEIVYGNTSQSFSVKDVYRKKSGYQEVWTVSIDKVYIENDGVTVSIVDRTSPLYRISFNPIISCLYSNRNTLTWPFLIDIRVNLW